MYKFKEYYVFFVSQRLNDGCLMARKIKKAHKHNRTDALKINIFFR